MEAMSGVGIGSDHEEALAEAANGRPLHQMLACGGFYWAHTSLKNVCPDELKFGDLT